MLNYLPKPKSLPFAKLALFSTLLVFSLFAVAGLARAQTDYANQTPEQWSESVECGAKGELCAEGYGKFSANSMMYTMSQAMTGLPSKDLAQGVENSVLGSTSNLIASMYGNPPASSIYYANDLLKNIGVIDKVYAQGIGYSALTPLLGLWKTFRNIAYVVLVVVLIVVGFMIMFRMNIDPQTVITMQTALPRIVVTLILITFSYAIAGFLIDLMYFAMMFVIAVLAGSAPSMSSKIGEIQRSYLTGGIPDLFGAVFGGGLRSVDDLAKALVGNPDLINKFLGGNIISVVIGVFQQVGTVIYGALFGFLLSIFLLFIFIRLFFTLLSAYIQVIIGIIFSPLQILMGALPGQAGFSSWLRNVAGNLMVFPTVAALLLLGMILTTSNVNDLWVPPFLIKSGGNAIAGLVGLGIIMTAPTLADKVKDMIVSAPPAISPLGPVIGGVSSASRTAASYLIQRRAYGRKEGKTEGELESAAAEQEGVSA